MTHILQLHLPITPWAEVRTRRLPGIQPLDMDDWLRVDDAFAAQMAERARLIDTAPGTVHALMPRAEPAAHEVLDLVLAHLAGMPGYAVGADAVIRPDGVRVTPDRDAPLLSLGRLIQEDVCIMQPDGQGAYVLTGAILCFPASWTLAEKMGRELVGIHAPVPEYDDDIAARVQRLFDAIRPERPLWRANALAYADPALHQPRREGEKRPAPQGPPPYIRSERQCLLRLPETRAVVFSIHTYMVARESLTPEQHAALAEHPIGTAG